MHFHREHPYPTRSPRRLRRTWTLRPTPAGWALLAYVAVVVGAVSAALYPYVGA